MMKVFVVGATGGIDRLVVEKALKADIPYGRMCATMRGFPIPSPINRCL